MRRAATTPGGRAETFSAFAPGKVIVLGEHSVVYGGLAVAGPLSWGVWARGSPSRKCQLKMPKELRGEGRKLLSRAFDRAAEACGKPKVAVSLESDLPVSMGLGSSAALSVACARLLSKAAGRHPSSAQVASVALQMEREFHGNPSGVDQACSAEGRLIAYRRGGQQTLGKSRPVSSPRPLKVLVALVGERGPTRSALAALARRKGAWPKRYSRIFSEMGKVAEEGKVAIERGDLEALGDAMNVNHGLLSALQLSSPALDDMVYLLRRRGALGAKLTGAGGEGGAVVGLFLEPEPDVAELSAQGVRCFGCQLAGPVTL
jgi:mevalonate kinase